ncbi:hypothetical protein GWI33_007987 [Rhynchophorus ferrugineus]|uniref:Protein CIP2A n=1 Tax=Rhynchophorus ferrugineus TaxID=354439 RepID=A0A834IDI2_RHYFE|nr:hypothetical protein GWI33_007987 [Rhynchophorus ferrugineus]
MDELKGQYNSTLPSCNGSIRIEDAFQRIKKLIIAIEEYIETKAEVKIIQINQYLQALSLTLDLSIFDPHTNLAGKFFISLYDLMNTLESRSMTSWYCVDVLINACKNHTARTALIETYQFLPCLARLIGDQLSNEKKTRLLRLMQDMTCGIKIHWQIPHMSHLISYLCKWIEKGEADVVTLSMGLLVNLCYRNILTVYILQRNVDLKKFIRICLSLKGPLVEVYVCQISIILENISGYIPAEILLKLIDCTFVAVSEAYKKEDSILLRQITEFFTENIKNNHKDSLNVYQKYYDKVEALLDMIENSQDKIKDSECTSVVLQFLDFLIEMEVPEVSAHFLRIISTAIKWIQESTVSFQALAILTTIANNTDVKSENEILTALAVGLPTFILLLNSCKDDSIVLHSEYNKRLGALLQLLTVIIQVKEISSKLISDLQEDIFRKIFAPLLGDDSPRLSENTCSIESVNLYIYALKFLTQLVNCDKSWMEFLNNLLSNSQIHVILAKAICQSPSNVKKLALELSNRSCAEGVSAALTKSQSIMISDKNECNNTNHSTTNNDFTFSLLSVRQNERLDNVLEKVENSIESNNLGNAATSDLMELYNYKLSYLAQAERTALASIEAATRHSSHLQHRLTRLISEQNQLQQSEFRTIQKLEESMRKQDELRSNIKDLHNRLESEKGKVKAYQSQVTLKEQALEELETKVKDLENKLMETTKAKTSVEEQLQKLKQVFTKVEENYSKLEKSLKKKDESLQDANASIKNYSKQVADLEKSLKEKQKRLEETTATLQMKSAILESITKMANSQI